MLAKLDAHSFLFPLSDLPAAVLNSTTNKTAAATSEVAFVLLNEGHDDDRYGRNGPLSPGFQCRVN